MGFGASHVDRLLMTGCTIRNNTAKGFGRGWEAGGEKIVLTRGAIIDHCRVLDNRGVGLWFGVRCHGVFSFLCFGTASVPSLGRRN